MPATKPKLPSASSAVLAAVLPFRSGGAEAGLPQRVKILAWGENRGRTTDKLVVVDEKCVNLSANQELVACDRVPMDYEHESVKGHPNYKPDPRHSPGYGTIEVVAGEGVFLSGIEYTPNGLEFAASYQDVSAFVHLDDENRPLWVSSVALTKKGDVAGMEFKEAVAALSALQAPLKVEVEINPTEPKHTMDYKAILLKLLGLPEGASDDEMNAAAEKLAGESKPAAAADTAAMSAIEGRLKVLEGDRDSRERQAIMDRAAAAGKVIPLSAEEVEQTPVAILSAIEAKLPAGEVPLPGAKAEEKPGSNVVALSADEANAARQLGLSPEEFRKANPKA